MGNRIYGCDDCLAACPWNKFAQRSARDEACGPRRSHRAGLWRNWRRWTTRRSARIFSGNPVKRIGHARFLRNVLLAIGNSGDAALAPLARARLAHDSPLVRGMAVWALQRLLPRDEFATLAAQNKESDPEVRAEWGMT